MAPEPRTVPDPVTEAYKRDLDRTLLGENLERGLDFTRSAGGKGTDDEWTRRY